MSITFTRYSATELRVQAPVQGAPLPTWVVEYHITQNTVPQTWSVTAYVGRDLTGGTADVILSADNSELEYAYKVGVADAPSNTFTFVGGLHGHETLASVAMVMDGVSVASLGVGQSVSGFEFVMTQAINTLLPKNANGSVNDVTVCGTFAITHTFSDAGLALAFGAVLATGYQTLEFYSGTLPANEATINRIQIGLLAIGIPTDSGATMLGFGLQAFDYSAWNGTGGNNFRLRLRLPTGNPGTPNAWLNAGPERGYFLDDATRKYRSAYIGSTYANRQPQPATGLTTAHQAIHTVEWGPPAALPTARTTIIGTGAVALSGSGTTRLT